MDTGITEPHLEPSDDRGERPASTARAPVEEQLRASEEKLRVLAHAMPQIVCVLSTDGHAEWVNERWVEFSGMDLAATRRTGWAGVVHPEDFPVVFHCRRRVLKSLAPQEVEVRYRGADGSYRWFLSRLAPVVEGNRVVRFVGAAMDIEDRKRAQGALEAELALKDQLAKVAQAVPGVICSFRLRPDGRASMPFSAPGIEELYGIPQATLAEDMGPAFANVHPDDLARALEEVARSARTMTPWNATFRYSHPVKGLRWMAGTSIPSREDDGSVLWHGYVADVTEQRRAEDALRRSEEDLRRLADAMPQLVWTSRADGHPEYANRKMCEYTGFSPADIQGDSWARALHPDDVARTLARWHRSLETGEPYEIEYRFRSVRDGAYRWFLVRAVPLRDGEGRIVRWFGTATDIQERRHIEDELRETQRALAEHAERLREEHRRKDEFLGMLSHELRNPLAPIRNSVYLLRHSGPEDADRSLRVIERQTEHLTRLVDDLLDVTRIARGKIQLRRARVDLRDVVRRTGEDLRTVLEERGVAYRVELPDRPLHADADATRIAQVIGNLLGNAAKFTREGDEVTLSLAARGDEAVVRVRDTGAGIDPALLPSLFEPFVQGERTLARSEGGLGLGLALVKGLVELHGGSVHVESAGRGTGATFTLRLPLAADQASSRPAGPVPRGAGAGGRRVLVVDDNQDAADSLAQLVRLLGHEVDVAYDGPSAVAAVRARAPDVVLCDIGLPGMDGYAVAREVRGISPRLLLVAVSGYAQPEDVARATEAGFDLHVAKPPDPERLVALLG
jgi:PAS domain S-box-containing protein